MGHKSGAKHAGAVGKQAPIDVAGELKAGLEIDIAEICRNHAESAISTLVTAMDESCESAWPTKVAAARDLLDRSDGKPATKDPEDKTGGLQIIVNQLYLDGKPHDIEITPTLGEVSIEEAELQAGPTAEEIDLHGDGASIVVKSPLGEEF